MRSILLSICSLSALTTAHAQSLTITPSTATDLTATAIVPGLTPDVRTIPAGLVLPSIDLRAAANGSTAQAFATVESYTRNDEQAAVWEIHSTTITAGTGALLAGAGPHSIDLTLRTSAPMSVVVTLDFDARFSSQPVQGSLCDVDVDVDGVLDFQANGPYRRVLRLDVTQQRTIRVTTSQTVAGTGAAWLDARLVVRVQRDLGFGVHELTAPCSTALLAIEPTFARQIRFWLQPVVGSATLRVVVLGTAMQPVVLPTPAPCLGVPRADAVLVLPADGITRLPVPPGIGTFDLFAQGLALGVTGELLPSQAYLVAFRP